MKRILFIFSLVLIISCQSPVNNGVSEENQAKFEQQIESFRTFTEGFSKEDVELTMSVIADDIHGVPQFIMVARLLDMMVSLRL